jgi:hypothetical protein
MFNSSQQSGDLLSTIAHIKIPIPTAMMIMIIHMTDNVMIIFLFAISVEWGDLLVGKFESSFYLVKEDKNRYPMIDVTLLQHLQNCTIQILVQNW